MFFSTANDGNGSNVAAGMPVLDRDGERIGRVARVHRRADRRGSHGGPGVGGDPGAPEDSGDSGAGRPGGFIEVGTGFFGVGRRLFLPHSAVAAVVDGCVVVREPRQQIESEAWRRGWYRPPPDAA
jgi:hypothetical protein